MSDNTSDRVSLATFLVDRVKELKNTSNVTKDAIEDWLIKWDLSRAKSPKKEVVKRVKKGAINKFIMPTDIDSSGRQKIPEETYNGYDDNIKSKMCDRTLKSGGAIFYCGAFPVNEDGRCPTCVNVKRTKQETRTVVATSLNTGLNGSKLLAHLFETNVPEIVVSNGYKIGNLIMRRVGGSESAEALGTLDDFECKLTKKDERMELPENWKDLLISLNDTMRKNVGRFSNITLTD